MTPPALSQVSRRSALVASGVAVLTPLSKQLGGTASAAASARLIRVDDHGAKGDGVSDDLAAVRAAVATLPDGGTLLFTAGKRYLTSATIEITDRRDVAVVATGATIMTSASTDSSAVMRVENCTNVRVTGGFLRHRHRGPRRNAADGLTINHCSDVVVEGVRVGYVHSMGIRASGSSRVLITACTVDGSSADGIGAYGGQRQPARPDARVTAGSTVLTSARSRFRVQDVGSTVTVFGAGAQGGDLVTRITAWRSRSQVVLAKSARTTVTNQFVKIQRPSHHVSFIRNRLMNTGDDAISSVGYRTYRGPNTDIVVEHNVVEGSHARGILLTGTSRGVISHNALRRIRMGGIFLVVEVGAVTTWGCEDVVIDSNVVETVGTGYPKDNYPGIGAASTDDLHPIRRVSISNNVVRDAYSYYIGVGGYSSSNTSASTTDVVVRGNRCVGGNRNNPAIHVIKSMNVTIAGNRIAKARASAVTVTSDAAGRIVVRANVVSQYDRGGSGWPALDINTPASVVSRNEVDGIRILSGTSVRRRR